MTWFLAWTFCGFYVLWEAFQQPAGQIRQFLLVFLAFWTYFELKTGRALLWRIWGYELWRLKNGVFTIKNSVFNYGKARDHFVENISALGPLEADERSWKWQLNESFWVMGGERLTFTYSGRQVIFGKGISEVESQALLTLLKREFNSEKKRMRQGEDT